MRSPTGMRRLAWPLVLVVLPAAAMAQFGAPKVVKVSSGGPAQTAPGKPFVLTVAIDVANGYHIQANKPAPNYIPTVVSVTGPKGFTFGRPVFPAPGTTTVAGETIPVYAGRVLVKVPVKPPAAAKGPQPFAVTVDYQACNEQTCYPPTKAAAKLTVTLGAGPKRAEAAPAAAAGGTAAAAASTGAPAGYALSRVEGFLPADKFVGFLKAGSGDQDAGAGALTRLLTGGNLLLALPLIFLIGLALNLTPCVYPLIPITIGYFGGQAAAGRKPAVLAIFYILGMAVMYSALGAIAGSTHDVFGKQLQNPAVLVVFAAIMFALALSQFDRPNGMPIWEFQLPAGLRNRAQARSGAAGALLMGLMVGVVAAPCIGPAVVVLLQWVGTHGNAAIGFLLFFVLALGLGLPYLFLASASGSIRKLPRSGEWMIGVKHIFGVVMVWMGFFYLQNVLNRWHPHAGQWALVGVTALGGVYLLILDRAGANARGFFVAKRLIGLGAVAGAVLLARPAPPETIRWAPYSESALQQAVSERRPVLVDCTAAWCAECKKLEAETFSRPEVGAAARGYVALRADLTAATALEAFARKYSVGGLPTVLRFVPAGEAVAER